MQRCSITLIALVALWGCGDDGNPSNQNNQNENQSGVCGNGTLEVGEECDEGVSNSDSQADACRTDCREAYCGDGVMDQTEECDEGGANSDLVAGACRRSCQLWHCGDGVLDPGEDCDDGTPADGDGCSVGCSVEQSWQCEGAPSQCACIDHRSGAACDQCVVYVNVNTSGSDPGDGRSWATAFRTVQPALDAAHAAGSPCEVWVASGTYHVWTDTPSSTIELRDGVALLGGFAGDETARDQRDWRAHETRLDGQDEDTDRRVLHVISARLTMDATVDGFIISRGLAAGIAPEDQSGAGVFLLGSSVWVSHCRLENNMALAAEGGGAMLVAESSVHLSDLEFADNDGGALRIHNAEVYLRDTSFVRNSGASAVHVTYAVADFDGVTLEDNEAWWGPGGALRVDQGIVTLNQSHFLGNHSGPGQGGGAISISDGGLIITESTFTDNLADGMGGAIESADATLLVEQSEFVGNMATLGGAIHSANITTSVSACTFRDNTATTGGAIYFTGVNPHVNFVGYSLFESNSACCEGADSRGGAVVTASQSQPTLANCTFVDNSAIASGGALDLNSAGTTVVNSILWGNTPDQLSFSVSPALASCVAQDLPFAYPPTVIPDDPLFVNPAAGDYELQSGSPCIDSGMTFPELPVVDRLGRPLVDLAPAETDGSWVDMGCFERQVP